MTPHELALEAAGFELMRCLPNLFEMLHKLDMHATAERVVAAYLEELKQRGGEA